MGSQFHTSRGEGGIKSQLEAETSAVPGGCWWLNRMGTGTRNRNGNGKRNRNGPGTGRGTEGAHTWTHMDKMDTHGRTYGHTHGHTHSSSSPAHSAGACRHGRANPAPAAKAATMPPAPAQGQAPSPAVSPSDPVSPLRRFPGQGGVPGGDTWDSRAPVPPGHSHSGVGRATVTAKSCSREDPGPPRCPRPLRAALAALPVLADTRLCKWRGRGTPKNVRTSRGSPTAGRTQGPAGAPGVPQFPREGGDAPCG